MLHLAYAALAIVIAANVAAVIFLFWSAYEVNAAISGPKNPLGARRSCRLIFGSGNCRWTLLGEASDVHQSDTRTPILKALEEATDVMGPQDIASVVGCQRNA